MQTIEEITDRLRDLGSAEKSRKADTICPTTMEVLGISNPDLKKYLNAMLKSNEEISRDEYMSLAEALVSQKMLECQMLAWLMLEKVKLVRSIKKQELKKITGILDNWVSVDTYGIVIYGILWRTGEISDKDVLQLQKSDDLWQRRLALVATVALNLKSRGGYGDSDRTIMVCENAVTDHKDMIVKALSWALRSLIRWDRNAVEKFIGEHHSRIHNRVLREVNHKLEHGTKN